jgi:hypothetical protein
MKREHLAMLLVAGVIAGGLWWSMAHPTGYFVQPQKQAVPDDDVNRMTNPHPDYPVMCTPEQHHHGYVYTPHRYPRFAGGEITAVIHKGFSTMRVPNSQDVQWLIAPPSEVMF